MNEAFEKYLHALRQDRDDKTELSDRAALETLLNAAAKDANPKIRIIHEAKKVRGKGGPDFKAMKDGMILGYVEDKAIGENLDQVLKSDQIARYKQLSGNILLTDYLQFIWLKDGKVSAREQIVFPHDLEGKPKKPRDDRVQAVSTLLRGFFPTAPEGIGRSEQLALALATRAHFLRDFLGEELRRQEKEHRQGKLYGLYEAVREQVFHELTLAEFADAFAQMVARLAWAFALRHDAGDSFSPPQEPKWRAPSPPNSSTGTSSANCSTLRPRRPIGPTSTRCGPGLRSCLRRPAPRRPCLGSPRSCRSTGSSSRK
jgi:hypothetical protein